VKDIASALLPAGSDGPEDGAVERILYLLDEMDRENMPNQRRAEILAIKIGRVTEADMTWAQAALSASKKETGDA